MKTRFRRAMKITIPVLLTDKSFGGIIQPLSLRVAARRGAGSWPPQIAHGIEELASKAGKTSEEYVRSFLPIVPSIENTTIDFPSRGAALGHLQIGLPHLLSVLLGLYALGVRTCAKQNELLAGEIGDWIAFAEMRSDGALTGVDRLDLALELIYNQQDYWSSEVEGQSKLRKLLLSEESKSELLKLVDPDGRKHPYFRVSRVVNRDDAFELYSDPKDETPWLTVFFSSDCQSALATVFSDKTRTIVSRALKRKAMLRLLTTSVTAALVFCASYACYYAYNLAKRHHFTPAETIRKLNPNRVAGFTNDELEKWTKDYPTDILSLGAYTDSSEERRFFVSIADRGSEIGWLHSYDGFGHLLFKVPARHQLPFDRTERSLMEYDQVFGANVHRQPGTELVALSKGDGNYSRVSIISETGVVLSDLWLAGQIGELTWIPNTSLIIARGVNTAIRKREEIDSLFPPNEVTLGHYSVLFALDFRQPPRLCEGPPYLYTEIPDLPPLWYYALLPGGRQIGEIQIPHSEREGEETIITVFTEGGYRFRLAPDGTVYSIERADTHHETPSNLLNVRFPTSSESQ